MIEIFIHAVDRAGMYEARHEGRLLCRSATPFLDGARCLIARGFDPNETLAMLRTGKSEADLTGKLGEAAQLTVHEGRRQPRFVKYRPTVPTGQDSEPVRLKQHTAGRSKADPWEQIRAGVAAA